MNEYQNIWNQMLVLLKEQLGEEPFENSFSKCLEVFKFENSYIYVKVPNSLIKYKIERFYAETIKDLTPMVTSYTIGFKFIDEKTAEAEAETKAKNEGISKIAQPDSLKSIKRPISSIYSFENFVAGESNRYAYITAMNVAKDGPRIANPLYIFGDVGLGKTHLMSAIGNYVLDNNINAKVIYISSSKFAEEYFLATSSKGSTEKIINFYEKYRDIDYFLVDDIQLLENKTATQEEFFKVFDELVANNKQIIVTSDRPASNLKIMARLKSRFSWGISVEIKQPNKELQLSILRRKLAFLIEDPSDVDDSVLEIICDNFKNSIRDLEGALRTFVNYCVCMNAPFNKENLYIALEKVFPSNKEQEDTTKQVIKLTKKAVSDYYKVSIEELDSDTRKKNVVYARQILMYVLRNDYNIPLQEIGDNLGARDHTTIGYGVDKVAALLKTDELIKADYTVISKKIKETSE